MFTICKHGHWSALFWIAVLLHGAPEQRGTVQFAGQPVPGATVTASQAGTTQTTVSDLHGNYYFPDLPNGPWSIRVTMLGFQEIDRNVTVALNGPAESWTLTMLPLAAIVGDHPVSRPLRAGSVESKTDTETGDSLLINGSVSNGAASPFGQQHAFGNDRKGAGALYNGNLGFTFDNAKLDARAFSLTGQDTPKPDYNHFTGLAALGGPLRIPRLLPRGGPDILLNYQWTRNRNADTLSGLMPSGAQRNGDFAGPVLDPFTGQPFAGNAIPSARLSRQAQALLNLYPLPNFNSSARYNYQIPVTGATHQDKWQARINQDIQRKNQVYGSFSGQSSRTEASSLFRLSDTTDSLGMLANAGWRHIFTTHLSSILSYQYSRLAQEVIPNFAGRRNISGEAGIGGNDQTSSNWGPPALTFASGIASLSDEQYSRTHNQTNAVSSSWLWIHGAHYLTMGADFKRQQFNLVSQQDPRGSFSFTGATTGGGNDFASFLLGIPDTSSIAFGNADKYFRANLYDAYLTDDLRISDGLTVNAGLRWDYGSPLSERYGRLANLSIAPGFQGASPISGSSLIRPDRLGFEPRAGIAWRPIADSSMLVRAGYGIYDNSSVYLPIVTAMAQQPPFSKSFSVQNTAGQPITLADGFSHSPLIANTYAVNPDLRVGYAQNWSVSVQRDLPASLIVTALYLGSKGTHGLQELLPNTYPAGETNPCPACPAGFTYLTSNGNSTRESAQVQLRRRLHHGLAAALQYTFSKSIDNTSLGGGSTRTSPVIAQNWLDLAAERGLSDFDQRQLLTLTTQYSTGMGAGGGALLGGWRGRLVRDWTLLSQVSAGSGLPQTPIYFAAVNGTGVTGSIRPDYTGAALYQAPVGLWLNPAAYAAPASGRWGTAGRNSIGGPGQFVLNASLARTFRLNGRLNFDLRVDAMNALNHVTFTNWNTMTTSRQFGLPAGTNAMRSVQTTVRFRF